MNDRIEYHKQYYKDNKEKIKLYGKTYNNKNKETVRKRQRKYRLNNKEKICELKRKWYLDNKPRLKEMSREYQQNNKEKLSKQKNIYYKKNKEKIGKMNSEWKKNNPEKQLEIMKRHLTKYGKTFDMNIMVFSYALINWSKNIKKLDNYMCKNCDSTKNLNAHHIQPKSLFPKLSLDLDNGITLCKKCHGKTHGFEIYK